jgi:hypothetical protein
MSRTSVPAAALLLLLAFALILQPAEPRLQKASRAPERSGWIQVHLEGTPSQIGYQHGYLLAREIQDNFRTISTEMMHEQRMPWDFFRKAAQEIFWPRVEEEYRQEIEGIVAGQKAHGGKLDLWDVVALNAWLELPYYQQWASETKPTVAPGAGAGDHCSAFVATGSYTKDGRIVIAHNNWTSFASGTRWNIIFDIRPARGNRILMDGAPGLIHSGDDFGINSSGILITETTIGGFHGFDPAGVPEFVRARKAMQYAGSIDDFARIMKEGNNGGYANNWLVADSKSNEVASLELGLKNVILQRTKDGFFVGSNFPADPKLMREETTFDPADASRGENARHKRWLELMEQNRGKIDLAMGQSFMGDHFDSFAGKVDPGERTLCGHIEASPRGMGTWQAPFAPAGAVQNKAADAADAEKMTLTAALGHACGTGFNARKHLAAHPEFDWAAGILRNMPARGWDTFTAR